LSVVLSLVVVGSLSGCGGGGGGAGSAPAPTLQSTNQSPGGFWTTQYTLTAGPNTGDTVNAFAVVTENGQFYYAATDQTTGCVVEAVFGQLSVSGNSISGSFDGDTPPSLNTPCAYPVVPETGTISGTISQRSEMTLALAGNASNLGPNTFTFSSEYNEPSSLATIAGNYTDNGGSNTLSINADGVIFEQDPTTGCVTNGQVSVIDAQYNVYSMSLTFDNCTGTSADLNGVTLTGFASLDHRLSPAVLSYGLSTSVDGVPIVVVHANPKQ